MISSVDYSFWKQFYVANLGLEYIWIVLWVQIRRRRRRRRKVLCHIPLACQKLEANKCLFLGSFWSSALSTSKIIFSVCKRTF